jgi:DNA-binding transcriptional MerR regulator
MAERMKVGDLARRTGLSIRTLHHYDEIGLLPPTERTATGHRLYGRGEVERLQQIASLRYLGLSLDEIRDWLATPGFSIDRALDLHLEKIDQEIGRQTRLRDLVRHLRDRLRTTEGASVDELTRTIEVTMNYEKYYSPEQLEQLEKRRALVGDTRIQEVQREWQDLFAAYQEAMDRGLDPGSDEVRALARKSAALVAEFTGGDAGIAASLQSMYRNEGADNVLGAHGTAMAPGLWDYMQRAAAVLRGDG